jgi:hypothetical protein
MASVSACASGTSMVALLSPLLSLRALGPQAADARQRDATAIKGLLVNTGYRSARPPAKPTAPAPPPPTGVRGKHGSCH